ncbi:MAG: DUF6644 family protein [Gammaproteobacteria bacterium]
MIEEIFLWLGRTAPGVALQQSTAAFAATEALHILGLSLVGGVILVANLSVLGVVLKSTPSQSIFAQSRLLYVSALSVVAVSGLLLVAAGPYKYYTNPLFPVKLALLAIAATLHAVLGRRLRRSHSIDSVSRWLAAASLVTWTAVVVAGRWLGLI